MAASILIGAIFMIPILVNTVITASSYNDETARLNKVVDESNRNLQNFKESYRQLLAQETDLTETLKSEMTENLDSLQQLKSQVYLTRENFDATYQRSKIIMLVCLSVVSVLLILKHFKYI